MLKTAKRSFYGIVGDDPETNRSADRPHQCSDSEGRSRTKAIERDISTAALETLAWTIQGKDRLTQYQTDVILSLMEEDFFDDCMGMVDIKDKAEERISRAKS